MMTTLNIVLLLLNAAFIGTGIYLSSYLKRKAENLATREDFEELRRQTASLTQTTKEIETTISGELWDRQRRWELKRDVIFEAARKTASEIGAMERLHAVYMTEKQASAMGKPGRPEKKPEVATGFNDAAADFEGAVMLVSAACGHELVRSLLEFGKFMRELSLEIMDDKPEAFMDKVKEMTAKSQAITLAIRKELEIAVTPKPQSDISSAAPSPG